MLPVPEGARFCPSCGTSLTATSVDRLGDRLGDEERRVVTVLFADLVGFTTLSEHRDPEQVKRLVDAVFEQLVADVESHGGVVDKVLGDAIVALFGAPVAHEDDADRAVRAGLAMQRTLQVFRDEHPADDVRMRIGVNTGEVLVGTLAGTDYTATGDVVNTASRLQEVAPAGQVMVGDATKQLCSSNIRFEPVDAVQLRGRMQATTVWRAVAVDTAPTSQRWTSDLAFVDRRSELGVLRAVTSTVLSGRGAIVAVSGEAGIGKSRLVSEALAQLTAAKPDTLLLHGACAPYGESNVWWPVAGGVLARFGLDRNTSADEARRRIVRRLSSIVELQTESHDFDRTVELVLHLLGHESALDALSPAATRDAVVGGMVAVLRERARTSPVVVWVDDLQWSAPVLLDLLESLARQLAGMPVMIVTTYRPQDDVPHDWPPPVDPALTVHLSLEPLDADASSELVVGAARTELDEAVLRNVAARGGGNPLYLIELARLAAASDAPGLELPGSLRALVAARLDELPPGQRALLDNAAILGTQGRASSLREFADELGQRFDPADLAGVEAAGLLTRDGPRWRFRSDVVREVAYHTLTKQSRAQRHAGVASYLARYEPTAVDPRAHHSASAAELRAELGPIVGVPETIAVDAVELLMSSAVRWNRQGAHRRGLRAIERALALDPPTDPVRRRLLLVRAETLVDLHELRAARTLVGELMQLAEAADDQVVQGEARRLLGTIEQLDGDLIAARRELGLAVERFRELDDRPHLAEALRARGFAEVFGGSLADAEWFFGEAAALFDELGDARGQAWVLQHRAWVSFLSGDHLASEQRLAKAIDAFERLDDRGGRTWSCGLLAYVHHFSRRDDAALDLAASVLEDARQWGDEWGASMMLNLQASIRLWRGEIDDARSLAERSLAGFRRIDDRFGMIQALGTLNRAHAAGGRLADADRTVEEVLVLSDSFGEMAYPAIAAAGTAMHLGQGTRAGRLATDAVGRLDTTGANVDEGRVVLAFGSILDGDPDAALAHLLDVDVKSSPFALAARATASAMIGDRAVALADARAVEAMGEVSYWDRSIAAVAAAAAATGEEARRRRDELRSLVLECDDVIISSYAGRFLDLLGHEIDVARRHPIPIGGWATVAELLAGSAS